MLWAQRSKGSRDITDRFSEDRGDKHSGVKVRRPCLSHSDKQAPKAYSQILQNSHREWSIICLELDRMDFNSSQSEPVFFILIYCYVVKVSADTRQDDLQIIEL